MNRLVTVGIPVYRRLDYLPNALRCVALQDYPNIELIVSDNGLNGSRIREIVETEYPRPWRLRQNTTTVSSAEHFNQIIEAASGEYFTLLADDDEISTNFISELASLLDRHPDASLALSAQEVVDKVGVTLEKTQQCLPELVAGADLIHAVWRTHEIDFYCFVTNMARTRDLRAVGGFPHFTGATHDDDAVIIRLCLGRMVALSDRCTFRWRKYGESLGWSISIAELGAASREFLSFLDEDDTVQSYATRQPQEWPKVRTTISAMVYGTYLWRWRELYRGRMPLASWLAAVFAMPPGRGYYRYLVGTAGAWFRTALSAQLRRCLRLRPSEAQSGERVAR